MPEDPREYLTERLEIEADDREEWRYETQRPKTGPAPIDPLAKAFEKLVDIIEETN